MHTPTPERVSAALSDLYNKPMQYRSAAATYEPGIAQVLNDRYATILAEIASVQFLGRSLDFSADGGNLDAMWDRIEDEIPTMPPRLVPRISPWGKSMASMLCDAAGSVVPVEARIPEEWEPEEGRTFDDSAIDALREWMAMGKPGMTITDAWGNEAPGRVTATEIEQRGRISPCSTSLHALHHDTSTRPVVSKRNPSPPSP